MTTDPHESNGRVPLRDYVEARIDENTRRIHELQARNDVMRDKFYAREEHEEFAIRLEQDLRNIRSEIEEMRKPKWQLLISAIGVFIVVVGAVWALATTPINSEIAALKTHDQGLEDQLKESHDTIHKRIDKLYELYQQLLNFQEQRKK